MAIGTDLEYGVKVNLPCETSGGYFPDENRIRIVDKEINPIVGYVNKESIIDKEGKKFILALIMGHSNSREIRVLLPGEIISGMNPVTLPIEWVKKHLK